MACIPQQQFRDALDRVGYVDSVSFGRAWKLTRDDGMLILEHYGTRVAVFIMELREVLVEDGACSMSDVNGINSLSLLLFGKKACKMKDGEIVQVA